MENLLRLVRWIRWHRPLDTYFKIRALEIWGRARYLSVTAASYNIQFCRVSSEIVTLKLEGQNGGEIFSCFETWRPERGSNPRSATFQTGSINHCTTTTTACSVIWLKLLLFFSIWVSRIATRELWTTHVFSLRTDISSVRRTDSPVNTKHLYHVCTTSGQRLWRWSNIVQM